MKLSISHKLVPIVKRIYLLLIFLRDTWEARASPVSESITSAPTNRLTNNRVVRSDTKRQKIWSNANFSKKELCFKKMSDFPKCYSECNATFNEGVLKKAYDPNFLVPVHFIAEHDAVKKFLNEVNTIYTKLQQFYMANFNDFSHESSLLIGKEKMLYVQKMEDMCEKIVKREVLLFMQNANRMAYKACVELRYIEVGSKSYNTILLEWYNGILMSESTLYSYENLFEYQLNAAKFLIKILGDLP